MDLNIYALGKDEGPAIWFLNQLVIIKAGGKQTGNAFSLVEMLTPVGGGAPYHVHRADDETFHVMEGQLEFISGERRFTGGPGTTVFLPRNIPHGFRVVGTSPARFLVFSVPAGFDEFVIEAGVPATAADAPLAVGAGHGEAEVAGGEASNRNARAPAGVRVGWRMEIRGGGPRCWRRPGSADDVGCGVLKHTLRDSKQRRWRRSRSGIASSHDHVTVDANAGS